jgi:D-alanine--poly(phosphoribitol) ligase subunit 1
VNLLERIDHWAAVAPTHIAHVSGERKLTYGDLRTRSDALAAYLLDRSGDDRAPIAVLGHREPEMLIAFLGAVKSGRPYVPIDTALPQRRIDGIVSICRPALFLTAEQTADLCEFAGKAVPRPVQNEDAFYSIFTSGSTGEPKGVVITLGCLEHFLRWMLAEQKFSELNETFLNQAPFSFDLSVMDLYCSLATGGTLFSISRDLLANPKMLYRALAGSHVTTWVSTPSFAQMCLAEETFREAMLPHLRRFLFCGETLALRTAAHLLERFPCAEVWNTYGPTEATVATTSIRVDNKILQKYPALPVGRPMSGTEVFILDQTGEVLPPDNQGEIVIAGPNVSPGYLARPDLTAKVFFEHRGQRAYRTGDQGRFREGLLFFEGRIDQQIKLNGYRVEIGDIEVNLRALPSVRDAIALPVMKDGTPQSVAAFVILSSRAGLSEFETAHNLRKELGQRLPVYMLPRKFVFLDEFPMTPNGKADRAKLAAQL